ncbi:hypothetical protein BDZ89DRAFT_1037112 [Hymenopellis radicata]|nr:hypothetical protein BDZ89DRAFT_1037112 [Hymenopellis radicata]
MGDVCCIFVIFITVRNYERVPVADIPSQFLSLYRGKHLSSDSISLIKTRISSLSIPAQPSPTFTVDVDVAWQCLLEAQQLLMLQPRSELSGVIPSLISWCLYFLEAIPLETLDNACWPEIRHPFALIPCLVREHKRQGVSASPRLPLRRIVATMLKISVKVALLQHRDSLKIHGRIEHVFHVLYSFYPEIEMDYAIADACKVVSNDEAKELASRLAFYVVNKPLDLPIEHVVRLIGCLSKQSARIHSYCLKANTPRWASHVFRAATGFLATRKDEWTAYIIEATATYLSWLFVTETETGKVIHIALSRKLLPALFQCIDHKPRLWTTPDEASPVATLLKYLAARIMVWPTTGRKAQNALSRVKSVCKRGQLREGRLLNGTLPETAPISTQWEWESEGTYRDLWARWESLIEAIDMADMEEESCANLQVVHDSWTLAVENMQWLLGLARMLEGMLSEDVSCCKIIVRRHVSTPWAASTPPQLRRRLQSTRDRVSHIEYKSETLTHQSANDAHSELPAVDLRMCIVGALDQCGSSACTAFAGLLRAITNPKRRPRRFRREAMDSASPQSNEQNIEGSGDDEDDEEEFVGGDALAVMVIWSMKTVVVITHWPSMRTVSLSAMALMWLRRTRPDLVGKWASIGGGTSSHISPYGQDRSQLPPRPITPPNFSFLSTPIRTRTAAFATTTPDKAESERDTLSKKSKPTVLSASASARQRSRMSLQDFESALFSRRRSQSAIVSTDSRLLETKESVSQRITKPTTVSTSPVATTIKQEDLDSGKGMEPRSLVQSKESSVPQPDGQAPMSGPKCSICGETGHNRRTCPTRESEVPQITPVADDNCDDPPNDTESD